MDGDDVSNIFISIPSGAIKSKIRMQGKQYAYIFQFLLVRLKGVAKFIDWWIGEEFQFLLVRLKVIGNLEITDTKDKFQFLLVRLKGDRQYRRGSI